VFAVDDPDTLLTAVESAGAPAKMKRSNAIAWGLRDFLDLDPDGCPPFRAGAAGLTMV
jgi:hypothetical protein